MELPHIIFQKFLFVAIKHTGNAFITSIIASKKYVIATAKLYVYTFFHYLHIVVVTGVVYGLDVTYMVSFLLLKTGSLEFPPRNSRINDFGAQHWCPCFLHLNKLVSSAFPANK